jgi:hypothetical protein
MNSHGRKKQQEIEPINITAVTTAARRSDSWISFNEAVNIIAYHRRLEFRAALGALREACLLGKVGWRHTPPLLDDRGRLLLQRTLPLDMESVWYEIRSRVLHPLECNFEIRERDLDLWPALPRRGPERGKVSRYGDADKFLFREIDRIVKNESKSITEAVRNLEDEGKIKGHGTPESKVRRVSRRFRKFTNR